MTLQQIRYVTMIAQAGSMNEAAKKLFISQPSLSGAIKELEKEVGIIIFSRTSKGVVLTAEGEEFLGYARQILNQVELLEEKYLEGNNVKKKFGVSTQHYSFAVKAFVEMVKAFDMDEYEFAIRETKTADVIRDVSTDKSQIGILYLNEFNEKVLTKLFRDAGLEFTELFSCGAYAYVWKNHPLADREEISIQDLQEYPCLAFEQGNSNSFYFAEEIFSTYDYKRVIKACDRATMEEVIMTGRDLSQFVTDFIWYLRNLLLVMTSDGNDISDMLDMSAERLTAMQEEAEMADEDTVMRYIRVLSELSNQMKFSTSRRVLAEVAIVKLAKPQMENSLDAVLNRIANLERGMENQVFVPRSEPAAPADQPEIKKEEPKQLELAVPEEIQQAVDNWRRIQGRVTRPASIYLKDVRLTVTGEGKLLIVTKNKIGYELIGREDTIAEIEKLIAEEIEKQVKVEVKLLEEHEHFEDKFVEITKNINMEIEEEDF